MKIKILCVIVGLFFTRVFPQQYNLTNTYTTDNSNISGNFIFDIVEDKNSFIWIATQNGVSRFDGKKFYNYGTKDGLTSSDTLQLLIDGSGTLWVNCFKQVPCYFDEKYNRFVAISAKDIEKFSSGLTVFSLLKNGNVSFTFQNNINLEVDKNKSYRIYKLKEIKTDKEVLSLNYGYYIDNKKNFLSLDRKGRINQYLKEKTQQSFYKNCIFNISENSIEKYYNFKTKPFSYEQAVLKFDNKIKWKRFTFNKINVITSDNYFYEYDFDNFKLLKKIKVSDDINSAFIDSKNHFFGGTQNNGLKFYTSGNIKKIEIPKNLVNENFISLDVNEKGELFAGNYSGEILIYKNNQFKKIKLDESSWIRKNLFFGNKTLTISDQYFWINFKNKKSIAVGKSLESLKNACKINDSIALLSTINGIYKLNVLNSNPQKLNFPLERVGKIIPINNNNFYIITATGLYQYDFKKNTYQKLYEKYNLNASEYDGNLLFVSTLENEVLVFKKNKLIDKITNPKIIAESLNKMLIVNNRLWVTSKSGIYIINYREKNGKVLSHIENFNKNDGLNSNDITYLADDKENVFVATGKGIAVMPKNITSKKFDIKTHIISLKINEKQREIKDNYHLEKDEDFLSLTVSGIETSGHFSHFKYRINDNQWISFFGNNLNLKLSGGKNYFEIFSVDNNGNESKSIRRIIFDVAIPFYETFWFWILVSGIISGGIIFAYSRWKYQQQKIYYRQKLALESQRKKITADLHDDLGATLSSLQINSAIAQKLFEKNPNEAQLILEKIEIQAKSISENIGNIIWSMKPSDDEFMTLSTRIKNFASEILGNTEIPFSIEIEESLDKEITNFTLRKNIVLICKEALNNIAKYSKATQVKLILNKKDNHYHLIISDNGIGFKQEETKGNGLRNMRKRVEEMNGNFEIFTEEGTSIIINIPIIREA